MVIRAKEARLRQYFFYMRNVRYIAKRVFRRRIKIKSGGGKQAKKGRKTERCRLQVATVFLLLKRRTDKGCYSCRKVFLNFGENRLTNFFLGI